MVTERSGSTTYLTTGVDHHCVIVQPGERDGRAAVGFEVPGSLTDVQRDLKKLGVDAELRSDPQPDDGALMRAVVMRAFGGPGL